MVIDSITSMWIPLELMHINITANACCWQSQPWFGMQKLSRPKNIQAIACERWADEQMISREISHFLSLGRTPQSSACYTVVNGSVHTSLAANHPEPCCTNSSCSKETPLMSGLCMVVSHKQQLYIVFPRNDNGVLFI